MLHYYDDVLETVSKKSAFTNDLMDRLLLERMIHVLVESILDTGNQMIDGFIMRDPGSYYDIIDILIDEKVLPNETEASYKKLIDARQQIVKHYYTTDLAFLIDTVKTEQHVLKQFSSHIRNYLDQEMGVANAFANETETGETK